MVATPRLLHDPIPRDEGEVGGGGEGGGKAHGDQQQAVDAMDRAWLLLEQAGKRRKRKKRRKRRLPWTSSQVWRRLPSSCACLPTFGATSLAVSRVRRRVGLPVPGFLSTVCRQLATAAQRQFRFGLCSSAGLEGEGGYVCLDMSEYTCGVADCGVSSGVIVVVSALTVQFFFWLVLTFFDTQAVSSQFLVL